VAVAQGLTVSGQSTLAATSIGALSAGSANVGGAVQAGSLSTGGGLNVAGQSTLAATTAGSLTVNGGSTLASAAVSGSLSAGSASVGALNVGGTLTARSAPVATLGTGTLLASGTSIANTAVLAKTDGFAVIYITGPGDNSKSSFAYGGIYTVGNWFQILGGTVGSFGSGWSDVMNNNNNSACIPIPAYSWWQYWADNAGGNQMNAPISIYWFPTGGGTSVEDTYEIVSAAEMAQHATPPPPPPQIGFNQVLARRQAAADRFLATLEGVLDKPLGEVARSDLSEQLLAL
jgi:hypothetical protein